MDVRIRITEGGNVNNNTLVTSVFSFFFRVFFDTHIFFSDPHFVCFKYLVLLSDFIYSDKA